MAHTVSSIKAVFKQIYLHFFWDFLHLYFAYSVLTLCVNVCLSYRFIIPFNAAALRIDVLVFESLACTKIHLGRVKLLQGKKGEGRPSYFKYYGIFWQSLHAHTAQHYSTIIRTFTFKLSTDFWQQKSICSYQ